MSIKTLQATLRQSANNAYAKVVAGFFKTGPGAYGEGDIFLGIRVPLIREIIAQFSAITPESIRPLLRSKYHEERLAALLILVDRFENGTKKDKSSIFRLYLKSTRWINNWDLVDLSAPDIVGAWLLERPDHMKTLEKLALSKSLWDRRIAIVATYTFIKHHDFRPTLQIALILLHDKHDLIQKAVGWMLREAGKRNLGVERKFLDRHAGTMPRTALRYAIERFSTHERKKYMGIQ